MALGLIDIGEFEERSAQVSAARQPVELEALVSDLPGPGAIASSATDRLELRGALGSLPGMDSGRSRPGCPWCAGSARWISTSPLPGLPGRWS